MAETTAERRPSKALLAEGLHQPEGGDIPPRFEPGSFHARISWFAAICLSGIGMFIEAYVIISTGQIKSIWKYEYPECWQPSKKQHCPNLIACCGLFPNTPEVNGTCVPQFPEFCDANGEYPSDRLCTHRGTHALSYTEFAGIMAGMVFMGLTTDFIGRVRAGVLTSCIMIAGVTLMGFYQNNNLNDQFIAFAVFFGFFGIGVGGEYPITATNAAVHNFEVAMIAGDEESEHEQRMVIERNATARRGETIALAFAMQGAGAVVGSIFILILIYFSGQSKNDCGVTSGSNSTGTDPHALNSIWRTFYFIGGLFITLLMLFRALVLEEGQVRQKMLEYVKERDERIGKVGKLKVVGFYLFRLLGTGGNWLVMDVAFYGLKLFSSPIFSSINPHGYLLTNNGYLLLNNVIGLLGYWTCAANIDKKWVGRKKLQLSSFLINFVVFSIAASRFHQLSTGVLMFLFFLTNYFVNFGANTTTYVMAAETYPVELRGTCHGLSAFSGKVGALAATIAFGYLNTVQIFWVCAGVNAAGFICTVLFSADMTGVSLDEHTAQLELWLEGRPEAYKGVLNKREHLSNFEIWTGWHGEYDPNWINDLIPSYKKKLIDQDEDDN